MKSSPKLSQSSVESSGRILIGYDNNNYFRSLDAFITKMNLDAKENFWLIDQLKKCRCCFESFNYSEEQVEITEIIEEQFLELTQIEVSINIFH